MRRVAAIVGLVVLLALSASAQSQLIKATIPFDFVAAGKTMPAGDYQFRPIDQNGEAVEVTNLKTNQAVIVKVVTRIATVDAQKPLVTFDVVGGKQMLESVLPGVDDGYLINVTKQKHTHRTVSVG